MGKDRERQAIAQVACPACGAAIGTPCALAHGRPVVHTERRRAWQAARPTDPLEDADILMSSQARGVIGPSGHPETYLLLAPLSDRGRAALPAGLTRVEHTAARQTLSLLRSRGLIIMPETP